MGIVVQDLIERKTGEQFPNIVITNPNEVTPAVIKCLEKGDMQLIMCHKGKKKVVGKISPSAYNIDKLLRVVGDIVYNVDKSTTHNIKTVYDYVSNLA